MFLLIVYNAGLGMVILYLAKYGNVPSVENVDRATYLDLSLSVLNAMIALVAIFLAVAGLWGYTAIRDSAERIAEQAAKDKAEEIAKGVSASVADRVARDVVQIYSTGQNGSAAAENELDSRAIHEHIRNMMAATVPEEWRKPIRRPTARLREGDNL